MYDVSGGEVCAHVSGGTVYNVSSGGSVYMYMEAGYIAKLSVPSTFPGNL